MYELGKVNSTCDGGVQKVLFSILVDGNSLKLYPISLENKVRDDSYGEHSA